MQKTIDLTKGNIYQKILLFFLPLFASSIFQQLYSTMDAIIVGQIIGKSGIAAIDAIATLLRLPVTFFNGIAAGTTILVSNAFGKKDYDALEKAEATSLAFAFVGGILLSVFGVLTTKSSLSFLSVPDEIYASSFSYAQIFFAGLFFSMIYNVASGILRAVGNTRVPLHILIVSGAINIGLDYLFVGPMQMGVKGAALATLIAQAISSYLSVRALVQVDAIYQINLNQIKFYEEPLKKLLKLGLPAALQFSLYPIGNTMLQITINTMGTDNIAAYGLIAKLDLLLWLTIDSFGPTITTFVAQNMGANQKQRAKDGTRAGMVILHAMVFVFSILLYFYCVPLGKLFINPESYDILPLMQSFMHHIAPYYFFYVTGCVYGSAIQGANDTMTPMLITLFGTCILRILWIVFYIPSHYDMYSIILSLPTTWAITSILFIIAYFYKLKKGMFAS